MSETVGALGERGLIRLLRKRFSGLSMAGDDSAVLPSLECPVVTTDTFLEGSHFHRWWAPSRVLGRRLLEATLSDLAAMGAEPMCIFTALQLPPDISVKWLLEFYEGLLQRTAVPIAGGETVRSNKLSLTLTAIGEGGDPQSLMRRSSLRDGDVLWVTGPLGKALDAPELLSRGGGLTGERLESAGDAYTSNELEQLRAFLCPRATLDKGYALRSSGVRCAIDISDGLLSEAGHLAAESEVSVIIDVNKVPFFRSAAGRPLLAVSAGEDFELLFGAPCEWQPECPGCVPVGRAEGSGKGLKVLMDGREIEPPSTGYDHMEVEE